MRALLTRVDPAAWFLALVLATALATYVHYRQQYVGATDWYGYHQQAELMRQGRVDLPTEFPVRDYSLVVPFGYNAAGDRALPQYPPGFPLLLALGGLLGLEFYVPALVGLLGGLLMYLLVRDYADRWTAAVFTLLWLFFPIVVFSSTGLMSDMTAAVALMAAWWLYRRDRVALAAFALGFGICVRPTNVLFLVAFALPLWRDRQLIRFGLWLVLPCLLYAAYNHVAYGAPWRTGYGSIGNDLRPGVFLSHLSFYAYQTFRQLGWGLAVLALIGLATPHRDRWFLAIWSVLFLGFYSFWLSGGDRWWWTRFLLPGYAPVFLFAVIGLNRVRGWLDARWPQPAWRPILLGALALTLVYEIDLARHKGDVWVERKGFEYYQVVRHLQSVVPPGSYVGSVEFGGALLVYTELKPFASVYEQAPAFVRELHQRGRQVCLVVEPWHRDRDIILKLLAENPHERLPDLPLWGGIRIYRLHPPP